MSIIQCFVCKKDLGNISANIFTSQSMYSDTFLYKFLELFMSLNPDDLLQLQTNDPDNYRVCPDCNSKINIYDQGVTMAEKAQHELTRLINSSQQIEFVSDGVIEETTEEKVNFFEDGEVFDVEIVDDTEELEEKVMKASEISSSFENEPKEKFKRKYVKKNKEGFSCDLCGVSFGANDELKAHVATHIGLSPLQCPSCNKIFTQKGALVRHMPMHTGKAPFICHLPLCQKRFIHYSSYHMHRLGHEGIKDKKCEECGGLFISNSHLRRHQRIHSGEKPYVRFYSYFITTC